jgi:hypothetical protein
MHRSIFSLEDGVTQLLLAATSFFALKENHPSQILVNIIKFYLNLLEAMYVEVSLVQDTPLWFLTMYLVLILMDMAPPLPLFWKKFLILVYAQGEPV